MIRPMRIEQLAPADADEAYPVIAAALPYDQPDVPPWSRRDFAGRLARPRAGHTFEGYLARTGDGSPAGFVELLFPQRDNTAAVFQVLNVHPAHRRRGVGRALLGVTTRRTRELGRRIVFDLTFGHRPDGAAFAAATGFQRGLSEARSRLDVADYDARRLSAPVAPGYRLVQWVDHAPDDLLDDLARLDSSFLDEAPTGDLDWEAERVDAARVRETEEAELARGRTCAHTGALDATGRLVAWTALSCEDDNPWHAWQQITLVDPAHRGHGLGLTIKCANLSYARSLRPELSAVDTLNAETNVAMLRVNERMGFRKADVWTRWQLTMP